MRFFVGDFGTVPITFEDEKDAIIDLTGRTAEWHFRNRDGTIPASTPLVAVIDSATDGEATFTVPASLTSAKTSYFTTMKIKSGAVFIKSSVSEIQVDVDTIEGS